MLLHMLLLEATLLNAFFFFFCIQLVRISTKIISTPCLFILSSSFHQQIEFLWSWPSLHHRTSLCPSLALWFPSVYPRLNILPPSASCRLMLHITSIPPSVKANNGWAVNAWQYWLRATSHAFMPPPTPNFSEYGTARINIFPLATARRLDGCIVTDGQAVKQWAVAAAT